MVWDWCGTGGACGYSAEVVSKYCDVRGVEFTGGVNAERLWLRADCSVSDDGLQDGLEVMHLFLKHCICPDFKGGDVAASERAKRDYRLGYECMQVIRSERSRMRCDISHPMGQVSEYSWLNSI